MTTLFATWQTYRIQQIKKISAVGFDTFEAHHWNSNVETIAQHDVYNYYFYNSDDKLIKVIPDIMPENCVPIHDDATKFCVTSEGQYPKYVAGSEADIVKKMINRL